MSLNSESSFVLIHENVPPTSATGVTVGGGSDQPQAQEDSLPADANNLNQPQAQDGQLANDLDQPQIGQGGQQAQPAENQNHGQNGQVPLLADNQNHDQPQNANVMGNAPPAVEDGVEDQVPPDQPRLCHCPCVREGKIIVIHMYIQSRPLH